MHSLKADQIEMYDSGDEYFSCNSDSASDAEEDDEVSNRQETQQNVSFELNCDVHFVLRHDDDETTNEPM